MDSRFLPLIFSWLSALAVLMTPLSVAEDYRTNRMRLWTSADETRLIIETAAPVNYKAFWLQSPARLVLDVEDGQLPADFLNDKNIGDAPYLHTARSARYKGKTRFVFEPAANIIYESRVLPPVAGYGHRIILDIAPQERPDPLSSLIQSLVDEQPPFLVVIDPGHGGEDPGAVSRNKAYEKNVVLQIAQRIKKAIDARPGMRAVLTRKTDRFLPLAQRVLTAHRLGAHAFVSVHADSVESPKARGSSVYILSKRGASSRLARRLAQHANLGDLIGGATTKSRLGETLQANEALEFARDGKERDSRRLAELLISKISKVNTMHKPRVESAGFAVLKSSDIPSVLVETAFISNPSEERKLLNGNFQQKMANAVADGLQEYRERYTVVE